MDLNVAARAALVEMIGYLEATRGFAREAAYALCSVAVDLRVSEAVDAPYPLVSALLPLDVFDEGQADRPAAQSRSGTA
jgi:formamidase